MEEGGFLYDSDAYDDDLPYFAPNATKPYVVVPYSLETNDMRFQRPESPFITARLFAEYVNDAFDCLHAEAADAPKMMTVGLHTRIIGRPSRSRGLEMILKHMRMAGPNAVWFATREQIARHWIAVHGG
jgi:peptidoglycan/xylan/chitin deacetylase (PgdA/CDA1 family)